MNKVEMTTRFEQHTWDTYQNFIAALHKVGDPGPQGYNALAAKLTAASMTAELDGTLMELLDVQANMLPK